MEIYVIANIKSTSNILKGYRLIDIASKNGVEIKDVTKQQLLYVLQHKVLEIENAKRDRNSIKGIYSALDNLGTILCSDDMSELGNHIDNKYIVLKQLVYNNDIIGAYVSNTRGDVRKLSTGDLYNLCIMENVVNAQINGETIEIKAKKQDVEIKHEVIHNDTISDEEARDKNSEWSIVTFMKYMEQHKYKYTLYDCNGRIIEENSKTFIESKYARKNGRLWFGLSNIDSRCKILHVPLHVRQLQDLWDDSEYIEMDTIIVSKTVDDVTKLIKNFDSKVNTNINMRWLTVKRLWFQNEQYPEDCTIMRKLKGFSFITITNDCNMPLTLSQQGNTAISDVYNYCDIPYVPKIEKYNIDIILKNSFNYCKVIGVNRCIDLTNIHEVEDSFRYIYGIERLVVGNTVRQLKSIFITTASKPGLVNPEVNFKSTSLIKIDSSFNLLKNYDNYNTIDLSEAVNLRKITGSFLSEDISEFILPDSLAEITGGCGCNLRVNEQSPKKIILPASISSFDFYSFRSDEFDNLDWSKSHIYSVTARLANACLTSSKLILADNFKKIHRNAFQSTFFTEIGKASNIDELMMGAFAMSSIHSFDSRKMPKLKEIPTMTFSNSEALAEVILDRGIDRIGDEAFKSCFNLQKIFLSDTIEEFGKNIFKGAGTRIGMIKAYVIKGSQAHKKLKNKANIIQMVYDTYEEALTAYLGQTSTEQQKSKFRMLMSSNTDFSELMQEPYLSNCQKIMKIIQTYNSDNTYEDILNYDRIDINGPNINIILKEKHLNILDNARNIILEDKEGTATLEDKALKLRFMNYVNLLTSVAENHNKIFRKENKELFNVVNVYFTSLPYIDLRCAIMVLTIQHLNNIQDRLILIIIDNKIVWSHIFLEEKESCLMYKSSILKSDYDNRKDGIVPRQNKLSELLQEGDHYSATLNPTLYGCQLPREEKYTRMWDYIINSNWILLDTDKLSAICEPKLGGRQLKCGLTWYDLTTGKIVTTNQRVGTSFDSEIKFGNKNKVSSIEALTVTGIYDLDRVIKTVKSKTYTIENMLRLFNNKEARMHYELLLYTEKELNDIYEDKNNYDTSELKTPTLELLAKTFREYKVTDESRLTKDAAKAILESGLCYKTNESLSEAFEKYGSPDTKPLFGNKKDVIMHFELDNTSGDDRPYKQHLYAVTNLSANSDNVVIYKAYDTIKSLILKISSLDSELKGKELYEINDEPINVDDFTFFLTKMQYYVHGTTYKLEIAIQHKTMEVFIVGNWDDIDYYPIFRFRNFHDADEVLFSYKTVKEAIQGYQNIDGGSDTYQFNTLSRAMAELVEIMRKKKVTGYELTDEEKYLDVYRIRELIKDGLPNNYPVITYKRDLLNKLAKQPRK